MIGIFKQKASANIVVLLVLGAILKLPIFRHPEIPVPKPTDGSLFLAILEFLHDTGTRMPLIYPLLAYALIFTQALLLNRIINTQRMMNRATYLPGMAYILITSLLPEWNFFTAPLLVNTILLFVLSGLFKTYNQGESRAPIFNIGFALGIASFLFFPALTFLVWILLALAVLRPFRLNEWLICILGVTTPFYFYGVWLFLNDQWSWANILPPVSVSLVVIRQSAWLAGSAFLLIIPFLGGGYYVQDNLRKMRIQVRKGWTLLMLYLLGAIFIPFVNNGSNFENWVIIAIPFAAFHACTYLYTSWKVIPLLIFWLTVGFIFAYQYV